MTLPTGSVTFLFTDVEGSTRLFQRHPDSMPAALARHHAIIQESIAGHGGHVFQVIGDAFCASFFEPTDALAAALNAQRRLHAEPWAQTGPLRVRMGLHTGPAEARSGDYQSGITLIRVQRIMAAGHGGQTLVSPVTAELIQPHLPPDVVLRDLGAFRLRGLSQPEHVFQLVASDLPVDFPPLRVAEAAADDQGPSTLLDVLVRGGLVGRGAELQQLEQHWARALQAHGHLVTLSGEPGIGKTRLAQELIDRARMAGAAVLRGGCYEYEATTPYLPFVEAVRDWAHRHSSASLRAHLGDTAPEIAKLAPEIGSKLGPLPSNPPLSPNEERLRLFDNVARFLQGMAAQRGLLFFADDLHWADQGTLSLLHYLLRHLRNDRVLFLAAYREVELDRTHALATALVDWNRERLVTRLSLGRLSRANTGELLAILFGEEGVSSDLVAVLYQETEGNPFFIEEVVKSLIEQGQVYRVGDHWERSEMDDLAIPQSIKEAIGRRLGRLSPSCVDVLHCASALGKQFPFGELAAASTYAEDAVLDALDEATVAQLLQANSDDTFAFTHDKIREVLYEELNPIRRRRLHQRIGESLEQLYVTRLDGHFQDLAYHFVHSGDLEKVLAYSMKAGESAERVFAHDEALGFYMQAREAAQDLERTPDLAQIDERLGDIYRLRGPLHLGVESYERALEPTTEPATRAIIKAKLGETYSPAGDPRGLDYLHQALAELDPETQTSELARATALVGRYHHYRAEHTLALQYLERARQLAEPLDNPETLTVIYSFLAGTHQHTLHLDESNRWAEACIELGQRRKHPLATALGHEFLGENAFFCGLWDEALGHAARNREIGERVGAQARVAWSDFTRASALHGQGELRAAQETAKAALELSEQIGEDRLATWVDPLLAVIAADLGNTAAALMYAERSRARAQALGQVVLNALSLHALGYQHMRSGEWELAASIYADALVLAQDSEYRMAQTFGSAAAAEALLGAGKAEQAAMVAESRIALFQSIPAPHGAAASRRVQGQILAAQERWEEAERVFVDAVTNLDRLGSRLELARALYHRAQMHLQRGDRERAQADGRQAQAIFDDVGTRPESRQAAALLAQC